MPEPDPKRGEVSWRELLATFARIGVNSFGGPAGQIGVMHKVLVDEKRWLDDARFTHALNFCMLLPGPEATQLATYVGWMLKRTWGGLAAGLLFVLPGAACMVVLSVLAVGSNRVPLLAWLLVGLNGAAVALVFHAVIRLSKRTLTSSGMRVLAVAAFVASLLQAPFFSVLLAAAAVGIIAGRKEVSTTAASPETTALPGRAATLRVVLMWLGVWTVPLACVAVWFGAGHVLTEAAVLYSKAALMSFGGAYAAIAYVSNELMRAHVWADGTTLSTGLALAETTPGPLVLVFQFFGYAAGYGRVAGVPAVMGGVLGSVVALWATFAPCFLWIFAGAPYMEALRANHRLVGVMRAISGAVVGVIAHFGLTLAISTMFQSKSRFDLPWGSILLPDFASVIVAPMVVAAVALYAIVRWKWGVGRVVLLSLVLGALAQVYMFLARSGGNWAD